MQVKTLNDLGSVFLRLKLVDPSLDGGESILLGICTKTMVMPLGTYTYVLYT